MSEPTPIPDTIGPYKVVMKLGEGGMGAVYKALDEGLGRHVAVKVLSTSLASDPESRERFLREARAAAVLNHPNVVAVYQIGEDGGRPYIAMELIEGKSLEDLLTQRRRIPAGPALGYVLQVVDGLEAAWKRGIVHRDIKPGNILIQEGDCAKLADFGLSKTYGGDKSLTQSGMVMGTPRYMSPEQGEGKPLDFRSDIYSLGATLYHMLAGSPPYDADTPVSVIVKHITSPIPSISAKDPSLPIPVCRVIERMLQKKAEDRPSTYDELREELRFAKGSLADGSAGFAPPGARPDDPMLRDQTTIQLTPTLSLGTARVQRTSRSMRPFVLAVVSLFVLVGLGALALHGRAVEPSEAKTTPATAPRATTAELPSPSAPVNVVATSIETRPPTQVLTPTSSSTVRPPATESVESMKTHGKELLDQALRAEAKGEAAVERKVLNELTSCIAAGHCPNELAPSAQVALGGLKAREGDETSAIAAFNRALYLTKDPAATVLVMKDGSIASVPIHEKIREILEPLHIGREKAMALIPSFASATTQLEFADRLAAVSGPGGHAIVIAAYQAVVDRFGNDVPIYAQAAIEVSTLLLKQGQLEAARTHLEAVVYHLKEANASWAVLNDALFLLGTVEAELGDTAKAEQMLTSAHDISLDSRDTVHVVTSDGVVRIIPVDMAYKAAMARIRGVGQRPRRIPEGLGPRPRDRAGDEKGRPPLP